MSVPSLGFALSILHRAARLQSERRTPIAGAVVVLALMRVALWLLPFRAVRPLAARLSRVASPGKDCHATASLDRVIGAVSVAARLVPAATCLVRAMATQVLLGRQGIASTLRLGVNRGPAGEFRAHAWVEHRGQVVIGGQDSPSRYSVLPQFG